MDRAPRLDVAAMGRVDGPGDDGKAALAREIAGQRIKHRRPDLNLDHKKWHEERQLNAAADPSLCPQCNTDQAITASFA